MSITKKIYITPDNHREIMFAFETMWKKVEDRYEASLELRDHRSFVRRHCAVFVNGKWVPRNNGQKDEFPF